MSNLIEQIMKMEDGMALDAIILQPKKPDSNGAPSYHNANAIIQRLQTAGGYQWCLRLLMPMLTSTGMINSAGSGIYGDINYVVKAAERQFGIKSDVREWIAVSYTDPEFPPNLLPGV